MTKFLFSNASDPDSTRPMDPHQEGKQGPQRKEIKEFHVLKRWMLSLEDVRVLQELGSPSWGP
jgi:hypothetical protein